jgi:2,2-dialkylglycine decarboxylase (pyruvate)
MNEELREAARDLLIRYGQGETDRLFVSSKGAIVTDDEGREILDFTSGQMCATLGHSHPAIVTAIRESAEKSIHLFSGMIPEPVAKLARKLADWLPVPLRRSMFVNTGSESNEAALRMAKLVTGGFEVIALGGSWHGVPGVSVIPEPYAYRCPIGHCRDTCDMSCMKVGLKMFDMASDGAGAAVVAEPILSAGGVIVPPEGYFETLKDEARRRGMMLIFDEAQTAFGRIGEKFAATGLRVTPDIMNVSKTLGGGLPLAATITSDEIEEKAHAEGYSYYTSHVSDPLPASVGLAVMETIEKENLLERAREMGAHLRANLDALQQRYEAIGEIRGQGLLFGIDLVKDRETREPHLELGDITTKRCMELGLSMNIKRRPERGAVWRIAPPLTVSRDELDRGCDILDRALTESLDSLARG